ncbi:hypothetical protein Tco_0810421 [Tanacetum coccineum]
MASLKPLFSIKECSSCGSLYTRECCSIGSLENKILVPEPDSSPCCAKCGTLVDGPYCRGCALLQKGFKEDLLSFSCGNDAHIGYNCPPKVPIISNPEQCNQTINELPQILPNVHPTCNYEDENSFISDSKPYSFNVSPSVFNQPPQPQFETYLCELCGNNAHYGYDCSSRVPFVYEQEPHPHFPDKGSITGDDLMIPPEPFGMKNRNSR